MNLSKKIILACCLGLFAFAAQNAIEAAVYYNNHFNNYYDRNSSGRYMRILSASTCSPTVESELTGIATASGSPLATYYLADGSAWQSYSRAMGVITESGGTFEYKEVKNAPKVVIYRDSDFFCKIKLEGENKEQYVYRL